MKSAIFIVPFNRPLHCPSLMTASKENNRRRQRKSRYLTFIPAAQNKTRGGERGREKVPPETL
jgi:hypothetical protein